MLAAGFNAPARVVVLAGGVGFAQSVVAEGGCTTGGAAGTAAAAAGGGPALTGNAVWGSKARLVCEGMAAEAASEAAGGASAITDPSGRTRTVFTLRGSGKAPDAAAGVSAGSTEDALIAWPRSTGCSTVFTTLATAVPSFLFLSSRVEGSEDASAPVAVSGCTLVGPVAAMMVGVVAAEDATAAVEGRARKLAARPPPVSNTTAARTTSVRLGLAASAGAGTAALGGGPISSSGSVTPSAHRSGLGSMGPAVRTATLG